MRFQRGSLPIIALIVISLIVITGFTIFFAKSSKNKATLNPTTTETQPTPSQIGLKFDFPASKLDPFNNKGGPFYHQVFLAKSPDGLNFTKEPESLFDKASVPDIIRLPTGRLLAYMVDGGGRSKSGIMVALSDDNGNSWDTGSVQLKNRKNTGAGDPEVILTVNGRIKLFYVSFSEKSNAVVSAVSDDGVNFEEDGIHFKYPGITDPDVININGKYFMYLSQGSRLIAASSADGLTFNLEKTIREKGSVSNTVYVDVDFYRQFYCSDGKIKSAKTSDGLNFQDEPGFRLKPEKGQNICDPAPVHLGGYWLMLYKVAPNNNP